MKEILLIRHGQAEINKLRDGNADSAAIGHTQSPLTPKGREQSRELSQLLAAGHGIVPREYAKPVAASEFLRSQQTAEIAGFKRVHIVPILNELDLPADLVSGRAAIKKHAEERWVPDTEGRGRRFIDLVRSGDLGYSIYFSHGLFIASVMTELEAEVGPEVFLHEFNSERGYIPFQAGIVKLSL